MPTRRDEVSDAERDDALRRLRAEQEARAVLDREQARQDELQAGVARELAGIVPRPRGPLSGAEKARVAMIQRTAPGWVPPEEKMTPVTARYDGPPPRPGDISSAAEARAAMERRNRG